MPELDAAPVLAQFAKRVIRAGWEGTEVDALAVQEWAEELGLIYSLPATKDDVERIDDIEEGDQIYKMHDWLRALAKEQELATKPKP